MYQCHFLSTLRRSRPEILFLLEMKPPADDIVPRSFPKIKPQDGTALYFQSKMEAKKMKKYPEWDCARGSVIMSLLQAEKELSLSEQRLAEKKRKSIKKRKEYDGQWAELELKEKVLQENFRKFNKFVRENQEKRERAERRIAEEHQLFQKRESEVDGVKAEIAHLTSIKTRMDQRIKEYRMFEDYLVKLAKATQMFKNPIDILIRYEALTDAKKMLFDSQQKIMGELDVAKSDMLKMMEEKSLVIMGLTNKLADLQGRYDAAKSNSLTMETLLAKVQDVSSAKLAEVAAVKTSCYNMYKHMCGKLKIMPSLPANDFEGHLLFTKKVLLELKKVNGAARDLLSKEGDSLKASSKKRTK